MTSMLNYINKLVNSSKLMNIFIVSLLSLSLCAIIRPSFMRFRLLALFTSAHIRSSLPS